MNVLYDRPVFRMTIMYGRRVGKSTLFQRFAGEKTIYYTAVRSSQRNLKLLGSHVIEALAPI